MTQSAAPATDREATMGRLNYLDSSLPSSLYRNGKMLLRRNTDGSDSELEGVVFAEHQVPVCNARLLEGDQRRTVEKNGFELLFCPLGHPDLDFLDHHDVVTMGARVLDHGGAGTREPDDEEAHQSIAPGMLMKSA